MKNFQELSNNVKLSSKYESKAPKIEQRVGIETISEKIIAEGLKT